MVRNGQKNKNALDQSLQRLEFDMEWSMDRSNLVRKRVHSDIQKLRKKGTMKRWIAAAALFFLLGGVPIYLEANHPFSNTAAEKEKSVYELEKEQLVFPLDAQHHIDRIIGEPSIDYYISEYSDGPYLYLSAAYTYRLNEQNTLIQIHTQKNELSIEEMMKSFLPHEKYPSTSYEAVEIQVGKERAVLTHSNRDYGGVDLKLVTKDTVYYLYPDIQMKDMDEEEVAQLKKDLVKLAELFKF